MSHKGKLVDKWEFYFDAYNEIFSERDKVETFLEIGIQNGGSLEVWSKFFPSLKLIVGCDVDENCKKLIFNDSRITFVVQNANKSLGIQEIKALSPVFNVVLDDGSHHSPDIIASFLIYFPMLTSDGVYVIEDLHASYWDQWGGGLRRPDSAIEFFKHLADVVNFEHWGLPGDRHRVFENFKLFDIENFPEEILASIYSVSFMNSICVIRKREPYKNELGRRLIHGEELPVTVNRKAYSGLFNEAHSQVAVFYKGNRKFRKDSISFKKLLVSCVNRPSRHMKSILKRIMQKLQR
jgi:cephalosporin hydroxylase